MTKISRLGRFAGVSAAGLAVLFAASVSGATEVPKEQWLRRIETRMPVVFCAKGTPFRACLAITAEQCERSVASATRVCIASMTKRIPATIRLPEDGIRLGGDIGDCAEDALMAMHQKELVDSKECTAAKESMLKAMPDPKQ